MENKALAEALILDELFDLSLYKALRGHASGSLRDMLDDLIPVETKHYAFWQDFFKIRIDQLNFGRRWKLAAIIWMCRIFGEGAIHLVLEAIEVYGIRKYLKIWKIYQNTPLAEAVRTVLQDEFEHEDQIVSDLERKINPERIRNVFLGFNDGLVEFVGAVGGFFAAFQDVRMVLVASATGAAAGALSMAVGVFISSGSEEEIQRTTLQKEEFLKGKTSKSREVAQPLMSAIIVGISYLFGAMVPILPVLFGAKNVVTSWMCGGIALVVVTTFISFMTGMQIRRRVLTNLILVSIAVSVAYSVGILIKGSP